MKGRLEGGVSINKEAGKRKLRSSGKISLVNGRADLYGHKFVVNKADSVFKDDIDNPLLYAEVVCDPSYVENDVLAGVKDYRQSQRSCYNSVFKSSHESE